MIPIQATYWSEITQITKIIIRAEQVIKSIKLFCWIMGSATKLMINLENSIANSGKVCFWETQIKWKKSWKTGEWVMNSFLRRRRFFNLSIKIDLLEWL